MTDQTTTPTSTLAQDAEEHVKQTIAWGQRFLAEELPAVADGAARAAQLASILAEIVKAFGAVAHEIAEHVPAVPEPSAAPPAPIVAGA